MSTKSVSFSEIGKSWPSQNIQPAGAKLPANILISPTYGCAMTEVLSVRAREDADERDAEVQREERLHVEVRLAAAGVRDRCRAQRRLPRRVAGSGELARRVGGAGCRGGPAGAREC